MPGNSNRVILGGGGKGGLCLPLELLPPLICRCCKFGCYVKILGEYNCETLRDRFLPHRKNTGKNFAAVSPNEWSPTVYVYKKYYITIYITRVGPPFAPILDPLLIIPPRLYYPSHTPDLPPSHQCPGACSPAHGRAGGGRQAPRINRPLLATSLASSPSIVFRTGQRAAILKNIKTLATYNNYTSHAISKLKRNGSATSPSLRSRLVSLISALLLRAVRSLEGSRPGLGGFYRCPHTTNYPCTHHARSRPRGTIIGRPAWGGLRCACLSPAGPPPRPLPRNRSRHFFLIYTHANAPFLHFFDSGRVVNHGPTSGECYLEYEKVTRAAFICAFSLVSPSNAPSLASQAIFHGRKWAGRREGKIRLVTIARFSWYAGISGIH